MPKSGPFVYFTKITAATWTINKIIPVSRALKFKMYFFVGENSLISPHDMVIYHLNESGSAELNPAPSAFGSVTSLQHQGNNVELLRKKLLMQDANETRL